MKFTVSMKNPDALDDAIQDAVRKELASNDGISADEVDILMEHRSEKVREVCKQWFEHGEYLTVEIDTQAGTCTVQRADR